MKQFQFKSRSVKSIDFITALHKFREQMKQEKSKSEEIIFQLLAYLEYDNITETSKINKYDIEVFLVRLKQTHGDNIESFKNDCKVVLMFLLMVKVDEEIVQVALTLIKS
jgi:hypothetical protein